MPERFHADPTASGSVLTAESNPAIVREDRGPSLHVRGRLETRFERRMNEGFVVSVHERCHVLDPAFL